MVQMQTGIVYFALPGCKFAIYRNRPGKVGAVTAILCTKVHQYHFAIFTLLVIFNIMQCSCPVATGNDGAVSRAGCPLL